MQENKGLVKFKGRWGGGMGKMDLAMKCPGATGMTLLEQMQDNNVEINTSLILKEITDEGIICNSVFKGRKGRDFKGDSIVICTSRLPDNTLAEALKRKVKEVRPIGDCVEPRWILDAIHEGWVAANQI